MPGSARLNRRALGRELTRAGRASVGECLVAAQTPARNSALRIGFTGPPGAGKSTLIARLAGLRLRRAISIGVLAIDPTSPLSHGSILGDRLRMDEVVSDARLYVRSMPSGSAHDGLSDNVAELLTVMDRYGFDEVMLETVGVGQADYAVRALVDTVVLVIVPESGDAVQAMKAGLLEMADIYVVNKADRPGASRTESDLRSILDLRSSPRDAWHPRVLATSTQDEGVEVLDRAIQAHAQWCRSNVDTEDLRRARARHRVESLLARRIAELIESAGPSLLERTVADAYRDLTRCLAGEDRGTM